jgi:hypothetical protein
MSIDFLSQKDPHFGNKDDINFPYNISPASGIDSPHDIFPFSDIDFRTIFVDKTT